MSRPRILINPVRVHIRIDGKTYQESARRAHGIGISFCDYVSRLLRADLPRKISSAERTPRVSRAERQEAMAQQIAEGKWHGPRGVTIMERRAARKGAGNESK